MAELASPTERTIELPPGSKNGHPLAIPKTWSVEVAVVDEAIKFVAKTVALVEVPTEYV